MVLVNYEMTENCILNVLIRFHCRTARRQALSIYTFLVRLYFYEDEKFLHVEQDLINTYGTSLEELHDEFYRLFDEGFCNNIKEKVVPNAHTFHHLLESRRRCGPLPTTSAEPFEAIYSILRRCYRAGTRNTPKQILQNFYIKDTYVIPTV